MEITDAEKYGYGTLAIFIVSILGFLGIVVIPCVKKSYYNQILVVLTGLAISTLFCDSVLHILPEVLGVEHEESEEIHVSNNVIRSCLLIISLYLLWLLEVIMMRLLGGGSHLHSHGSMHGHSHNLNEIKPENDQSIKSTELNNAENIDTNESQITEKKTEKSNCCSRLKHIKPAAWMLIASDLFHNLCDGLAIGASFSQSISLGISTTIAVVCHEIPHEIGDYAVFVQLGFKHWQALVINFGTTISCFIGFYIGASISSESDAVPWILSISAGMFFYIALVELMPQLPFTNSNDWSWLFFILFNLFMILGFAIMFLLVIFESHIKV